MHRVFRVLLPVLLPVVLLLSIAHAAVPGGASGREPEAGTAPVSLLSPGVANILLVVQEQKHRLFQGLGTAMDGAASLSAGMGDILDGLGNGLRHGVAVVSAVILFALIVEYLGRRRSRLRPKSPLSLNALSGRFFGTGLSLIRELLFAALFACAAAVLLLLLPQQQGTGYMLAGSMLVPVLIFRLVLVVPCTALAPGNSNIRLFPMSDATALRVCLWLGLCALIVVFSTYGLTMLHRLGLPENQILFLAILKPLPGLAVLAGLIFAYRKEVRAVLEGEQKEDSRDGSWLAAHWHVVALGYLVLLLLFREFSLLLEHAEFHGAMFESLVLFPLVLAGGFGMNRLVRLLQEEEARQGGTGIMLRHGTLVLRCADGVFFLAFIGVLLHIWGVELPFHGVILNGALTTLITGALGYAVWVFAKASIDRHLAQEVLEEESGEGQGAGGSRRGTLLTLLRKAILVFIVVTVVLVVLHGLGVDIGPLLAGAGIFGLAIGFGSQALVKDIISGIFYLLDDAFRIGDYVNTGSHKGSVEQISIRSFKLRHHRGMIHTIPYGELGAITNFSRDWSIMNLDLRLPFDTDVDLVRKIVKKIGKRLAANEEYGPKLLTPIKSKGIRSIDDSALVIRIKFKAKPGIQFVLRKELYQAIQREFAAKGIKFAPKKVTVDIPEMVPQEARPAVIAAAELATEEKKVEE